LSDSAVTPQFGALYKVVPKLAVFASYSESFVPGSALINNPDGTTKAPKPTQGKGYDVGLKTDFLDGRISSTISFFEIVNRNIVNDLAYTDTGGNVHIYNVQSGEQRSRGVEFSSMITATENWQVYLSYSYMDAKITEFSGHDAEILAQDWTTLDAAGQANYKNVRRFHNAPLQMSAPHLANLWTRYDFRKGPFKGAYVGGGCNFVYDQTLLPDTPESAHQTYILVNALAGYSWTWRKMLMSVDLMGKNLADEHYRPSQSTRSRPREFVATFTARF
jgi:iron complex outermembrane receptor protein